MSLFDDASLVMIPSGYKEDTVYSVKPTDGSGDLTFTRASDGTRVNSQGYIERVPWNLLQQTETFDNVAWSKSEITISTNTTTAPNGTTTADTLVENTANAIHRITQTINVVASTNYTLSVYVKNNGRRYFMINANTAISARSTFDLQNGVVSATSSGTASILSIGDGWYRCVVQGTASISTSNNVFFQLNNSGIATDTIYTGDGVSGFYIWGAQLNEGTLKPYFPTTDRQNVPRLDYSNGCPSLLLEPQRTNLNLYSQDLSNAYWIKGGASVVSGYTSPDGSANAYKLVEDTSTGEHRIYPGQSTVTSGASYTHSFFVKANGRSKLRFSYFGFNSYEPIFDFVNNVVISTTGGTSPTIKSQPFGNDWYFVSVTDTTTQTQLRGVISLVNSSNAFSYTGDGTSGAYFWGAQLEAGSYATSYIPTTSASVTRVADSCVGAGDSSTFNDSEGVLYAEIASLIDDNDGSKSISISSGGYSNNIIIQYTTNTNQIVFKTSPSYTTPIFQSYNVSDITENSKIAFKYKLNDCSFWHNGVKLGSVSSFTPFPSGTLTELNFNRGDGNERFEGKTNQILYFPTALTDDQCIALTTI